MITNCKIPTLVTDNLLLCIFRLKVLPRYASPKEYYEKLSRFSVRVGLGEAVDPYYRVMGTP